MKKQKTKNKLSKVKALAFLVFSFALNAAFADGVKGIDAASGELKGFIDPIGNLVLAIGAVVGFIGGIRVYIKWNSGDNDVQKEMMGWFGSCIFLVVIGVVIKAFFAVV